jgi:hypothetical protein
MNGVAPEAEIDVKLLERRCCRLEVILKREVGGGDIIRGSMDGYITGDMKG